MVFRDVTSARRQQREIAHQATHDSLTNLVNRREFESRLARVLDTAREFIRRFDVDQLYIALPLSAYEEILRLLDAVGEWRC